MGVGERSTKSKIASASPSRLTSSILEEDALNINLIRTEASLLCDQNVSKF